MSKNLGIAGKWDDCQEEEKVVVVVVKWGEREVEWGTANARNQLVKVGKKQSSLDAFLQPTQAEAQALPETGVRLLPLLSFAISPPPAVPPSAPQAGLRLLWLPFLPSRRVALRRLASHRSLALIFPFVLAFKNALPCVPMRAFGWQPGESEREQERERDGARQLLGTWPQLGLAKCKKH